VSATRFWLACSRCGWERGAGSLDYACARCGGQLSVVYAGRCQPDHPGRGMWRYADRLPLDDAAGAVSLGEGDTPLIDLPRLREALGVAWLGLKSEHLNPTGSFKDRVASVGLSIAVERELAGCIGTSSGNGGAAATAYGARAGKPVYLFVAPGVAELKLAQIQAFGARVWLAPDLGSDGAATERTAVAIAEAAAEHRWFPMLTGGRFSPEAMEGAKTIAFELSEQAGDATAVYVPVGGGGLLAAVWRGYAEVRETLAGPPPRMVAVQPRGSATLREALAGRGRMLPGRVTSAISGLQVPVLFEDQAASAVTASGGALREVDDEEVWAAQRRLAREEGLLLEAAGATALAGALADAAEGRLGPADRVIVLGTGSGVKDLAGLRRLAAGAEVSETELDRIPSLLDPSQ
jgi:threonine synthase